MKNSSFISCKNHFPFGGRLRRDIQFSCNDNSIHAQQSQFAILARLVIEQITSYLGIDFTVNRGREFTGNAGRPNRTVAIDEIASPAHIGVLPGRRISPTGCGLFATQ